MLTIHTPTDDIFKREIHLERDGEPLDKTLLKNGVLLDKGTGHVVLIDDFQVLGVYRATGVIDYEDGGVEIIAKECDCSAEPDPDGVVEMVS